MLTFDKLPKRKSLAFVKVETEIHIDIKSDEASDDIQIMMNSNDNDTSKQYEDLTSLFSPSIEAQVDIKQINYD